MAFIIAGSSSVPRASLEIYGRAWESIDLYDQDIDDDRRPHANYFLKSESTRIAIVTLRQSPTQNIIRKFYKKVQWVEKNNLFFL